MGKRDGSRHPASGPRDHVQHDRRECATLSREVAIVCKEKRSIRLAMIGRSTSRAKGCSSACGRVHPASSTACARGQVRWQRSDTPISSAGLTRSVKVCSMSCNSPLGVDAFFLTLTKAESLLPHHSLPRLISPSLFHWESKSTTSIAPCRRVRGRSLPVPRIANYLERPASDPIAIPWQLDHAMPADFLTSASAATG